MDDIILSVIIPTYNHEGYIRKAIDSVLMQKTQYKYEVLVGEDKSTDNTRKVLQQYEKEHPGEITVYYRDHNLSNDDLENAPDLRHRAKGKYIITLEGDDYWTSDNKIETQVDFLENNPEYIAVSHLCKVVGEDGKPLMEEYPSCRNSEYSLKDYLCGVYPGQLATVMCRNYYISHYFDVTILEKHLCPGDKLLYFALATNGKVKCLQQTMSAYRHVRKGGASYSANYKYNFEEDEHWYAELLEFASAQKKGVACVEALYLGCLIHAVKKKAILLDKAKEYGRCKLKHKGRAISLYLWRMINIHMLHRGNAN